MQALGRAPGRGSGGDGLPHRRPPQHHVRYLGRGRSAEEIALPLVAAEVTQLLELLGRLDALGHRLEPQRAAQTDDGADDGGVPAVLRQTGHEGAVHLQHVDGEPLQVPEARVAVPKSSMARRMPIDLRYSSVLTVASASPIAVPSVNSTSRPEASSPDSASTCPTS